MTRYEITAEAEGRPTFLIGYTPRLSRLGLLDAMRKHGGAVIAKLGIGDADEITWHTQPRPHATTAGWRIGFTGRTQAEARTLGEHPFIAEGRE